MRSLDGRCASSRAWYSGGGEAGATSWSLARLDAAAVRVRPLVLERVTGRRIDERRRAPRALVVGLVAAAIVPGAAVGVGDRFARLVRDEVLEVLRVVEAARLAAAAARVRHRGVLDVADPAVEVAVIGAVLEVGAAARGRGAVRRVIAARQEHLVDGAGVEAVPRDVLRY